FIGKEIIVGAPVPAIDFASAVLPLGNRAGEVRIVDWVILDMDRQSLLRWIERGPLRNCPALQYPIGLQAKVVMQPRCVMLLDDKDRLAFPFANLARRLHSLAEIALGLVLLKCHGSTSKQVE